MYRESPRDEVSQGDLFARVPFVEVDLQSTRRAILLTHDCQFDKPRTEFVLCAWIRPLVELTPDSQGNVRAGKTKSALYLPARDPVMSECYVEFARIAPVRKADLLRLSDSGGRIASLTDEGQDALGYRLHLFFSR